MPPSNKASNPSTSTPIAVDVIETDEGEDEGHIYTEASASTSLSPDDNAYNDEATTSTSTEQCHQKPTPSLKSSYDNVDASADHAFNAASTKTFLNKSVPAALSDIKNTASGLEVIGDNDVLRPPIPNGMAGEIISTDAAAAKKYAVVGLEQTEEINAPDPPEFMIATSLEDDITKKRGLIDTIRIDDNYGTHDHATDTQAERLVIDGVDDASTGDVSDILIPHAWRVSDAKDVESDEEDDLGAIIIATPTLPWYKYRRAQILIGAVFLLFAALATALGVVLTSQSPLGEQELTLSPTEAPQSPPPLLLQTPPSCNRSQTSNNMVNFGYYQEWAQYRPPDCYPLSPQEVNVKKFGYTHLAYAYGGISSDGFIEPYDGAVEHYDKYLLFNSPKASNPGLKTLISIGGWTFDQSRFVFVSSTEARRTAFANSVVKFIETHGFDGIDLDWEFPVTRQGTTADYVNYPLLCTALRVAFDGADRSDWLITVQTSFNTYELSEGFDMLSMAEHIDWFNLMSYNIHGDWDEFAGANTDMSYIIDTMTYIYGTGLAREKLVLGLAAFGRSTTLTDPTCITAGCPISGPGLTSCNGDSGVVNLFEIENYLNDPQTYDSIYYNPVTESMELITDGNTTFTSFDDESTFKKKYQYVSSECLRGIQW